MNPSNLVGYLLSLSLFICLVPVYHDRLVTRLKSHVLYLLVSSHHLFFGLRVRFGKTDLVTDNHVLVQIWGIFSSCMIYVVPLLFYGLDLVLVPNQILFFSRTSTHHHSSRSFVVPCLLAFSNEILRLSTSDQLLICYSSLRLYIRSCLVFLRLSFFSIIGFPSTTNFSLQHKPHYLPPSFESIFVHENLFQRKQLSWSGSSPLVSISFLWERSTPNANRN